MNHKIKTIYVIHHSHTDIGYTDLQERILDTQALYIKQVVEIMKSSTEYSDFRWNCETYFCVEQFLKAATEEQRKGFFELVRDNKIGLSATYLNFNDLIDFEVYGKRLKEMDSLLQENNIHTKTAMIADINGISMGQRDNLLNIGVEFLYTNIHTHHGMYPLFQNQNAYWWENKEGKRLLVWNGEHYNLGNSLGLKPNRTTNFMTENYFGTREAYPSPVEIFKGNLDHYLESCEENGYPYDFIITSVSGVFSDNAPPSLEILSIIKEFEENYGNQIHIQMVSLQELYEAIKDTLADVPVYKGDLTDWWANGVGSTPYAVKHYREALKMYHLCNRLDKDSYTKYPINARKAEDNFLLYAEHTWGHSSTITNPYDTMVLNLDMRKNSYASKAHESSAIMLNHVSKSLGDTLQYYNTCGNIKTINTGAQSGDMLVEFFIESMALENAQITCRSDNRIIPCQLSTHPRGILISFIDNFGPHEEKEYAYKELPKVNTTVNTRKVYIGAERVKDIINHYDPLSYRLPYELENKWFKITYAVGEGILSFWNKKENHDMLETDIACFFTPIYECTKVNTTPYEERRRLGRNIRGLHAVQQKGKLTDVQCLDTGCIFTTIELTYELEGSRYCSVVIKMYHELPKIDFKLKIAKTLSDDIESVYMPLTLSLPDKEVYLKKGSEAFRPGIDQLPGTCLEYYMSDSGIIYQSEKTSILINSPDVPLYYFGKMKHHPVKLCNGDLEDNQRDVYSWVMNNTWETNFKMDLSGFCEYNYSITLSDTQEIETQFEQLFDISLGTYTLITV